MAGHFHAFFYILAVAVLELLRLYPPLFHSGADISHLRSIDKTTFAWWIVQFYCLTCILSYLGSLEPLNGSFHSNPLDILLENLSKSEVVGLKGPVVGLSPPGPTLFTPLIEIVHRSKHTNVT